MKYKTSYRALLETYAVVGLQVLRGPTGNLSGVNAMWSLTEEKAATWCATDQPRQSITGDQSCLISFQSETGKKPDGAGSGKTLRINQDTAVVSLLPESSGVFLSVFDGHGVDGRAISRAAASSTLSTVTKEAKGAGTSFDPAAVLARALPDANDELPAAQAHVSGTTAIVAILKPSHVTVGCVGDSRCVLGREAEVGQEWQTIDLSVDQKPDVAEERARIEAAGGKVSGGGAWDGEITRVWHEGVGVAVSRSLGDHVLKKVGVIAEPVVAQRDLDERDSVLILASDGLWEFVTSQEAVALAQSFRPNADTAGRALCKLAGRRWRRESGDYRDDISVICVFLRDNDQVSAVDALVESIARHGTAELGANLDALEGTDNVKPPMDDDEETADEDDEDDDEKHDDVVVDEEARVPPSQRVEFKRRLTIVAPASPEGSPGKAPLATGKSDDSGCCAVS